MSRNQIIYVVMISAAIMIYIWLTWFVLPDVGVVTLSPKGSTLSQTTQNGYTLLGFVQSKIVGYRGIESIAIGWDSLVAAWPHVGLGALVGAILSYLIYEMKYRKLAAFVRNAEIHWARIDSNARDTAYVSICQMQKAAEMEEAANKKMKLAAEEYIKVNQLRLETQQVRTIDEKRLKKVDSLEKQLAKTKGKLRRIEDNKNR